MHFIFCRGCKATSVKVGQAMSKSFLGHSLLYATATIAPILVNFAITPVITRLLGPESYGVVGVGISLFQFGIVIFTLGLAASITRQAIIEHSGRPGAVATVVQGATASAALFVFGVVLLPYWGPLILPDGREGILLNPLLSCFGLALLQNSQSFLRAEQRAGTFVALGISASLAGPLCGVAMVVAFGSAAEFYLSGMAIGHVTVGLSALALCLKIQRPSFARGQFRSNLGIGLPTVPHQIAVSFMTLSLVSSSSHLIGLDAAGALQLALLVGSAPMLLLGAFNNAWAPYIYRTPSDTRGDVLASSYRSVMLLTAVMACGFAVVGPVVVPFVSGPMAESLPVSQTALIAALGAPFMASYLANIHMVFISGKTRTLALTTPLSAAVALAFVLMPISFGVPADIRFLALAVPIFQLLQLGISVILRKNRSDVHLPTLSVLPEILTVATALAASYFFDHLPAVFITSSILLAGILVWIRRDMISSHFGSQRSVNAI